MNGRAFALLGVGSGGRALALLGLIVSTPAPVVDVVGCAHATIAAADTAGATMHETDCASIASAKTSTAASPASRVAIATSAMP